MQKRAAAARGGAGAVAAKEAAEAPVEELNEYEIERQQNILRNQAFLRSIGLA